MSHNTYSTWSNIFLFFRHFAQCRRRRGLFRQPADHVPVLRDRLGLQPLLKHLVEKIFGCWRRRLKRGILLASEWMLRCRSQQGRFQRGRALGIGEVEFRHLQRHDLDAMGAGAAQDLGSDRQFLAIVDLRRLRLVLDRENLHAGTAPGRLTLSDGEEAERRLSAQLGSIDLDHAALGQAADLSLLPEEAKLSRDAPIEAEDESPVYPAGDLLTNEGTVTAAIGCGRDMALALHERFSGEHLLEQRPAI